MKSAIGIFSWTFHITSLSLCTCTHTHIQFSVREFFLCCYVSRHWQYFYASDVGWMNDAKWIETGMTETSIESLGWAESQIKCPGASLRRWIYSLSGFRYHSLTFEWGHVWHYSEQGTWFSLSLIRVLSQLISALECHLTLLEKWTSCVYHKLWLLLPSQWIECTKPRCIYICRDCFKSFGLCKNYN